MLYLYEDKFGSIIYKLSNVDEFFICIYPIAFNNVDKLFGIGSYTVKKAADENETVLLSTWLFDRSTPVNLSDLPLFVSFDYKSNLYEKFIKEGCL